MNLDILSQADLLKEASELAREQGITDRADWRDLVNVVVDGHLDLGELDKDQDLVALKQSLVNAWEEYVRTSGPESVKAIDEDPEEPNA